MAERRTVIIPQFQKRGVIGFAAFAGLVAGAAYAVPLWLSLRMEPPGVMGVLLLFVVQAGTPVLLGLAFSCWVAVLSLRRRPIVILSAVFWTAMAMGVSIAFEFKDAAAEGHHLWSGRWWIPQVIFAMCCGVVGAVSGGLVVLVSRALRVRVEQDGLWCWKCAYRIGEGDIAACPECGAPKDSSRFRFAFLTRALRCGRRIGWIGVMVWMVAVVAIASLTRTAVEEPPGRRGLRNLGKDDGSYLCLPGSSPVTFGPSCAAVRMPLNPAASLDLLAAYRPTPLPGEPVVQLQVSKVVRRGSALLGFGSSMTSTLPIPRVLCDLDEKQVAYIIENGVPASLKSAMLAASAGGTVGWTGTAPIPPDIRIDPTPHFPP